MGNMGAETHAFLTACDDDVRIAKLDVLRAKGDSAQARAADLIDAPCGGFLRQTSIDMRLTRGILALASRENLAQNGFRDFRFLDACAIHNRFDHRSAKIMGGDIGKASAERSNGGARGGCNNYVCHVICLLVEGRKKTLDVLGVALIWKIAAMQYNCQRPQTAYAVCSWMKMLEP
jgi:hypothetical protein